MPETLPTCVSYGKIVKGNPILDRLLRVKLFLKALYVILIGFNQVNTVLLTDAETQFTEKVRGEHAVF